MTYFHPYGDVCNRCSERLVKGCFVKHVDGDLCTDCWMEKYCDALVDTLRFVFEPIIVSLGYTRATLESMIAVHEAKASTILQHNVDMLNFM